MLKYDYVIVGGGAMGSAALYHLAKAGERVALIEQFPLGHVRGSSHGAARITRHSYADLRYARLMPAAFRAWKQLEADCGRTLYFRTGGVSFASLENGYVGQVAKNLAELDVPHARLSAAELARVYPTFRLPDDFEAVFEPDAGMLAASLALAVQIELARKIGGPNVAIFENSPVLSIDLEAEKPTVRTKDGSIQAERLIVTSGSWTSKLFPGVVDSPKPTLQQVLYFEPNDPEPFQIGRFPVFIYKGDSEFDQFYGMPGFLGTGIKAARHGGPPVDPDAKPEAIDPDYPGVVRGFLGRFLPSLQDAKISSAETCLYTMSPGDDFRIGFVAGRTDVLIASPCSGHGFKFSTLIGKVLSDLARGLDQARRRVLEPRVAARVCLEALGPWRPLLEPVSFACSDRS